MRASALLVAALFAGATASCGEQTKRAPMNDNVALGGDVVARVGDEIITRELVTAVATAQHLTPAEAARRLIDDAIAAAAARERGLDKASSTRWRLVAARARLTSDRLLAEARGKGPPTDEEVELLTKRHWIEVDRPPTVRVMHALVRFPKDGPSGKEAEARAIATKMREVLREAREEEAFKEAAKTFEAEAKAAGMSIVVENLAPFDAEGRTLEGGRLVEPFATAAYALGDGDTSAPVATEFGFHVIRLLERLPEQRMPLESRRTAFTDEAVMRRARASYEQHVEALRKATPVEVLASAEASMRELHGAERPR